MTKELVGPIRKSMHAGCMRSPHRAVIQEGPQDPICICPCHGTEYHLSPELAEWFGPFIDKEIK